MYYLYVLKSLKDSNLYVGSTNDLRRRLAEHNSGKVKSTMSRRPFELRYYEAYTSKNEVRKRESSLKKSGRTLAQLRLRISECLQ